ncbi:MAG: LysR family transcriptional regulator [Kordiimonadaceae bacterium]|nr:LysR family transcriptional regulator [Kordiimonadaceae bacterium]
MPSSKKKNTAPIASNLPSRKAMPPFEALRAFDAVARLGGVRKAAIGLDRDHAVISRHIRAIEAWTGTVLVERTSTGVILTDDGRRYHEQIATAIDIISNATSDLMKLSEQQALNIWCMPAFAFHWFTGHLGAFERAQPDSPIEVRPTDSSPDLMAQEADVDIRLIPRYGTPYQIPKGVKSQEISRLPVICVANPQYLADHPRIKTPGDLLQHQLLHEGDFDSWETWLRAHGVEPEEDLTGPLLWQGHLTLDAARHGRGIALSNRMVAADDLQAGRLVDITAGNIIFDENNTMAAYLFMARSDRWEMPSLRRFRNWLLSSFRD